MYTVRVYEGKVAIDERNFAYGTFVEIGHWLDHYNYNRSKYSVKITFTD